MVPKFVRDPIHDFIEVQPQLVGIVDSDVFQRLRGIAQLALTHLVYPGARHTRFEHSLGVMCVAEQLAEKHSKKQLDEVRLAALLHDVGHGPFSHVLDELIRPRVGTGIHEKVSRAIVESNYLENHFNDANQVAAVANLFDPPEGIRSVAQDIVTGPTDSDRADYLLRDAYFCGVFSTDISTLDGS